jgi:hypothetical protein
MLYKVALLAISALAALIGSWGGAEAGLIGDTVHVRLLAPDTSTVFDDFGTFTITGSQSFTSHDSATSISFFSNSQITVANLTSGAYVPVSFEGFDIQLISGPAFTSVTEDPSSSSAFATGSVLTFSASDIQLNFAGTCSACVGGEQIFLDVVSAVPAPQIGQGFAGVLAIGGVLFGAKLLERRKKRHSVGPAIRPATA